MFRLQDVFGNRELDGWRDDQIMLAAKTLNQLAADLIDGFDSEIAEATWQEALLSPGSFIANKIAPHVQQAAEPVIEALVETANRKLLPIVEHQAVWTREPGRPEGKDDTSAVTRDLVMAAAPIAGGLATAAALPAAAITTTGGLLGTGLFAATIVSWPVVVVGGLAVGAALATGAANTGRIWSNAEERLRGRVADYVSRALIRGAPDAKSALEQLMELFATTAREARGRR